MALVFVSHSGRDGPPDTNVGEQQRRESMRAARDALVSALRGNHRVWLDRERLGPGVDWEDSILSGLTACEVGVVLLDHETVAEPGYVLKEATILAYRRYLDRAFRFVTVALDDEVDAALADSRAWRAVQMKRWQHLAATDGDFTRIGTKIDEWAKEATAVDRNDLDQSVEYLAALLEKIRDDGGFSLMRLTRLMRLYDCPFDDADFTEPGRLRMCSREVGARLLATAAQEVPRIMSGIPPVRQRQELGRTLAANWVPLDVAAAVRTISAGAGDASGCASVGIEGPWDDAVSVSILAGDLIDRARRPGSFANYRLIMAFETADEAATDSPEAMAEHIEKTIMGTIPASASPARREARLEVTTPHVVLRAGTDEELTLVRQAIALVLTRVRRYVTFVVLVEPSLDDALDVGQSASDCWVDRDNIVFASALQEA